MPVYGSRRVHQTILWRREYTAALKAAHLPSAPYNTRDYGNTTPFDIILITALFYIWCKEMESAILSTAPSFTISVCLRTSWRWAFVSTDWNSRRLPRLSRTLLCSLFYPCAVTWVKRTKPKTSPLWARAAETDWFYVRIDWNVQKVKANSIRLSIDHHKKWRRGRW